MVQVNLNHQDSISSGDISLGLSGAGGDPIGVDVTEAFTFDGNKLDFAYAGTDTVGADAIALSALGNGIEKTPGTGELRLEIIGGAVMDPFNASEYDSTGRVISTTSTIEQNLSGTSTSGGGEVFFGSLDAEAPGSETIVNVLSGNADGDSVAIALSSAGFIQIDSGNKGNFAIPVFKF